MNIIIAMNEKYVEPAKTMLFSLFYNNREDSKVYLLHKDLSEDTVQSLRAFLYECGDVELLAKTVPSELFQDAPKIKWWSEEMYYRLLAFELVPEERVLWLDADIIVNGDIREFYYQDLTGKYCAACPGCNQALAKGIGLREGTPYFNSGVILFNLNEIRKDIRVEDVFQCLKSNGDNLKAPDQDILNLMFQGRVAYADSSVYNHESFGNYVYTKEKMNVIMHEAKIIHFNGPHKPWDPICVNSADQMWWKYELLRGKRREYCTYQLKHFPVKCKANGRELYFILLSQIHKLQRKR